MKTIAEQRIEQLERALAFFVDRIRKSRLTEEGMRALLGIDEETLADAERTIRNELCSAGSVD